MAFYVLKDVLNELYLVYLEQKDNAEVYEDKEYTESINVNPQATMIEELTEEELKEQMENETN